MKRHLTLVMLMAALAGCQATVITPLESPQPPSALPGATPTAPPIPAATPTPVASPLPNPQIVPGCDGAFLLCPDGEACARPSCAPSAAVPDSRAPATIEISQHQAVAARFGLSEVSQAEDALIGLKPALPLVRAFKTPCQEGDGLYRTNGRRSACVVYVAETSPGNYELLDTPAKIRSRYAPITTADEALALAVMLTGDSPRYALGPLLPGWRYYVRSIEPTRITADGTGFKLNLFDYQLFGCGPHAHAEVGYTVSESGELKETARRRLYEDPAEDGLCVD